MENKPSKKDETVKVVVRVRPMNSEEQRNGNRIAVEAFPDRAMISVKDPKAGDAEPAKDFYFDAVFGPNEEQRTIYDICAFSVVESVLNGYNGTIFAYGQTGSGKTHTMEGKTDPPALRGIIPNAIQHIFESVNNSRDKQYLVRASYLEIYNDEVRDLLSKDPKQSLKLKENIETGVYVKDLSSFVVKNVAEIDHVMQAGKKNRSTGRTNMNDASSRSHAIFTIVIECADGDGKHIRVGKLNLVDLAGSERQKKTGATGERQDEANNINMSLTILGNVISALADGKSTHVPYRDSKLTRLLQNSLGGNAKTVMCANCGPADYNYVETLLTLRYANRAKNIKNKPRINEDPKDAMLREYQEEINALKAQLAATQRGMILDESGREVHSAHNVQREVVEKIVEREVIKEIQVGASKEEVEEIRRKLEKEKEMLHKQAQTDMKSLIEVHSKTAQERSELKTALDREAEDRRRLEEQQKALKAKLKSMEEKLIRGGEVMSKAQQQERLLKKAEQELRERKVQEAQLARELAEKEEQTLQWEDHFSSLQEEVEVKTKKLKKLWAKYQATVRETKDMEEEFQTVQTELLQSNRQLAQTLRLKELIIQHFIPEQFAKSIEQRAVFLPEEEIWTIPKLDLTGNALRASVHRPVSDHHLRRPETEFARQRRQFDPNPRYKMENILSLDLERSEKTTEERWEGGRSRVDMYLTMDLNDPDHPIAFDQSSFAPALSAQYLSYDDPMGGGKRSNYQDDRSMRPVGEEASSRMTNSHHESAISTRGDRGGSNMRPRSASHRRREGSGSHAL